MAIILHVAEQSNRLTLTALVFEGTRVREAPAPQRIPGEEVTVQQPWGQLFFATVDTLARLMPSVDPGSRGGAVVILRMRGIDQISLATAKVLHTYAARLTAQGATLKIVVGSDQVERLLRSESVVELIGEDNLYRGNQWLGETVRRARDDALDEIGGRQQP